MLLRPVSQSVWRREAAGCMSLANSMVGYVLCSIILLRTQFLYTSDHVNGARCAHASSTFSLQERSCLWEPHRVELSSRRGAKLNRILESYRNFTLTFCLRSLQEQDRAVGDVVVAVAVAEEGDSWAPRKAPGFSCVEKALVYPYVRAPAGGCSYTCDTSILAA
eukprot:1160505-Pelagomonas_calceolata.AAC.5